MRKVLVLLILMSGHLYSLERKSTLKIYHSIFHALSSKENISVYTNDKEYRDVFIHSKEISLSEDPENTDIILITQESMLNEILDSMSQDMNKTEQPIIFVTNYKFLKISEKIIGAFYWRKGRSQLLFIKNRLERSNITLPEEYQKFMIDEL